MNEREIFLAVLDLPDAAARAKYLDGACSGDPARRARIESLLLSHDTAGSFLGSPAVKPPAPDVSATQAFGSAATPDDDANEADDALTFLTEPGRPDSLGRIGHYEALEVLGRGGFGIVFRAFDEVLQRVVAVKVLAPQLAATSPARKRFLREARSSAKVRHENVVQVYAVEEQPLPYLVMEFIPGETLAQRIIRTGPLETVEVVQIGRQIAEGLAAAHGTGLIHRDIKPGNILIEAGPHQHVKITDFGLARAADDASLTQSGFVAGTPMFMAPEQAQGETLDHRADLFSLGSVLYTMCSGRPPFRANSAVAVLKRVAEDTPRPIPEIIPETPPWLCEIITRLHAKKPEDRIGTAREVADLLGRGLAAMQRVANIPPAAVENTPPREMPEAAPAIRRPRFRTRRWAAAAAVLLLMVVGGLGFTEATGVTDVHGSVIRLFSPEGTLVVEVDDPEVSVKIDGSDIVITGAGAKEIRLKPGSYTVQASKDGKVVSHELVTVTKNGRQVVRVSQEAAPSDVKAATLPADAAAWERSVAAMPATDQVKAVIARLKELNPGFDGAVAPTIEKDAVTGLKFTTDHVTDISPVHALTRLQTLDMGSYPRNNGLLFDLSPLQGMPLVRLECGGAKVADLSPLKGMKLYRLGAQSISASDLTPLQGMPLTSLDLAYVRGVTNLKPLQGMPLEYLNLSLLPVSDLSALKGMTSLEDLYLQDMTLSDLAPLSGMRLHGLYLAHSKVSDLTPLKGMPLEEIQLTPRNITEGLNILRDMKSLKRISANFDPALPAAEFWDRYDKGEFKADAAAWERSVAAMPAAEQVKAVGARLKELNPEFDGNVRPTLENGVVTGLEFQTDHVSDIGPVHVLTRLQNLKIQGSHYDKGSLADLTPLKGMPLTDLSILDNPAVMDLSALKGMTLKNLTIGGTGVTDLTPLRGMPLESLFMWGYWGSDLTPLKGMPLKWLNCGGRGQKLDLSPLAGLPLEYLCVNITKVSDLAPLKDMPLAGLECRNTLVSDLTPLKGMIALKSLGCSDLVTDLSPLKGLELESIALNPRNITKGLDILRTMKSLKTIGISTENQDWPAAEFWARYDKGEFKE